MATNEQIIWQYFKNQGFTDAGTAGMMGNLFAESALSPINLQNTYNKKLGYSDLEYTAAVDNGSYNNFIKDSAGYGLAQWTYWSRKQNLLNFAKNKGTSIGDLNMQLDFLMQELKTGYNSLLNTLKTTNSVQEASNGVLLQFERPADQSINVQNTRTSYGMNYYNKYTNKTNNSPKGGNSPLISYTRISPNKTAPRNHVIDTISIHCVVGQLSVETIGNIFASTSAQASSNYGIGADGRIGMYVEEKDRSWCTSSKSNDHRAITIEVASDKTHPYTINDKAYQSLINLLVDICQRNDIKELKWQANPALIGQVDKQNMTVHRWFANKACPGDYLFNLHGQIAAEVNSRLKINNQIPNIIPTPTIPEEEEEEMTQEKFNEMMDNWILEQAAKNPNDWSSDARKWAEENKLVNGDTEGKMMYKKFLTREELIMVLFRALNRPIL